MTSDLPIVAWSCGELAALRGAGMGVGSGAAELCGLAGSGLGVDGGAAGELVGFHMASCSFRSGDRGTLRHVCHQIHPGLWKCSPQQHGSGAERARGAAACGWRYLGGEVNIPLRFAFLISGEGLTAGTIRA